VSFVAKAIFTTGTLCDGNEIVLSLGLLNIEEIRTAFACTYPLGKYAFFRIPISVPVTAAAEAATVTTTFTKSAAVTAAAEAATVATTFTKSATVSAAAEAATVATTFTKSAAVSAAAEAATVATTFTKSAAVSAAAEAATVA
jgi:hypothetical protein